MSSALCKRVCSKNALTLLCKLGRGQLSLAAGEDRFRSVASTLSYRDWVFHIGRDQHRYFLQLKFVDADTTTLQPEQHSGRKWLLSPHMTNSEIVQTAFKAVLTATEHEVREQFRYRDKAIFGPHYHVDELHALCVQGKLDKRKPP